MTEEETIELVQVTVVGQQGKSMLVQTADYKRYYLPASKIKGGKVERPELDKAIPYGVPWEAYLGLDSVTTESLALMLRQAGIYTLADLQVRDRQLIRIGSKLIGKVVRAAAKQADQAKPPRRK